MAGADVKEFRVFGLTLFQQVFIGLVLGVGVGYLLGPEAAKVKFLGTLFINLIKMVVVPLIFLALVAGITSMPDAHNFKRVGMKGFSAYLLTASFAVILGLVSATIFKPGVGLDVDLSTLAAEGAPAASKAAPSLGEFLMNLIPTNAIRAMADDQYLQVVIFAIFTGITMNMMGSQAAKARDIIYELSRVVFRMIEYIVRLAPLAVFGFMAWMVGTQGLESLQILANLIIAFMSAIIVQYLLFGVFILFGARISPLPFYKKALATQMMAFSTSSSKATLSTAMQQLQKRMGVSETTCNFMMPLGACINMDGAAIYLGICALFFAQLYGIHLGPHEYFVLLLTCTLGSIGAAGIPSGSIIFMGMVLNSVGLPIEGIGLILAIDRILDMIRTTINLTGDMAVTLIIDKSENKLNLETYHDPKA